MTATDTILRAHIALGTAGLILGPVAMTARKLPGLHTQAGEAYHWVMLGVCVSAGTLAISEGAPNSNLAGSKKLTPQIRVASETDLDTLIHLATAFRNHLGQSLPSDTDFRQSIAMLLKDAGTEFALARDIHGTALGYVQLRYRHSMWTSAPEAELEDVFVVGEARRRGVGRRLVEFAIAHALDRGCRSIGLNTNERNIGALALYRQCGFVAEHVRWGGGRQLWLLRTLEPV